MSTGCIVRLDPWSLVTAKRTITHPIRRSSALLFPKVTLCVQGNATFCQALQNLQRRKKGSRKTDKAEERRRHRLLALRDKAESSETEDSESDTDGGHTVLAIGQGKHYQRMQPAPYQPAPTVPHLDSKQTRPGWIDPQGGSSSTKPPVICFHCYVVNDHIAPQCQLTIKDLDNVVANYERLTPEQRQRVRDKSYKRARSALQAEEGTPPANVALIEEPSAQDSSQAVPKIDATSTTKEAGNG